MYITKFACLLLLCSRKVDITKDFAMVLNGNEYKVNLDPLLGHKFNEQKMLIYSSRSANGSIKVRFDVLEPGIGGRVKGVILEAVLYGFYDSDSEISPREPREPEKPQKLEIYNFVFDTTLLKIYKSLNLETPTNSIF